MAAYTVTNEALGARGVGSFLIEPNATIESVELTEEDALLLGELEGVTVKEFKAAPKAKAEPESK